MSDRARETGDVKALLQARIVSLVQELCPGGTLSGRYYMARNPTREDRHAGSFWIMIKSTPGAWRDEATGDKGDVFKLIAYTRGLTDFKAVLAWAKAWLNYEALPPAAVTFARSAARDREAQEAARGASVAEEQRRQAMALWLKGEVGLIGTMTDRYLSSRGIALGQLPRLPAAMRHFPLMRHRESGLLLPCMAVMMTSSETEAPQAVHRTWIALDGKGKADVIPARKIWPSFRGSVMRLARGETDMSVKTAVARGKVDRLALCEGVEDGLSIALACPELRVWAAGSLGNLQHVRLPDCTYEVIVCADNDWGKPQAEALLHKGIEALAAQGRPVRIARSNVGKDMNDALRGAA